MTDNHGFVSAICTSPRAGAGVWRVNEVQVITGAGLLGDRYAESRGTWNSGEIGKRQVTLMNELFFEGSGFTIEESRRNIFTKQIELMALIGRAFKIGDEVIMNGLKYCTPCNRPSQLVGKPRNFKEAFLDRGGLIASVLQGGTIRVGSVIVPLG